MPFAHYSAAPQLCEPLVLCCLAFWHLQTEEAEQEVVLWSWGWCLETWAAAALPALRGAVPCCRNVERYRSWESSFSHLTLCTDRRSISNFTLHETAFLADLIGLLAPPRVSCISPLWLLWQQIERGWEQLGTVKKMKNLPRFTNLPDPARPSSHGLPALAAGLGGDCC